MDVQMRHTLVNLRKLLPHAVLYTVAAVLALVGLFSFRMDDFLVMMYEVEIWQWSAVQTWGVIFLIVGLMTVAWPAVLAVSFWRNGNAGKGLPMITATGELLSRIIRIVRVVLIILFAVRALRYSILCLPENLVVYLIAGMLLFEGIMGAATYFFLQLMICFFSSAADAAVAVHYMCLSGKPEHIGITPLTVRTLWILGFLGIGLAVYIYLFPFVNGCMLLSLVLTAVANIWLGILLGKLKKRMAWAAYVLSRETVRQKQ